MNSLWLGQIVFLILGALLVAYGIMMSALPFIYKKDIKARYIGSAKSKKGYTLYFTDGENRYQTRYTLNKADWKKYVHSGEQEIYVHEDVCLLNPSYYFVRGLIAIGMGILIIAMAIVSF